MISSCVDVVSDDGVVVNAGVLSFSAEVVAEDSKAEVISS